MTMKLQKASVCALLLLSTPAMASDLHESIQDTLNNWGDQIEETRVWKLQLKPTFTQPQGIQRF